MLVPYNDPELLHETGNAAQRWISSRLASPSYRASPSPPSPYVIAVNRAGIKVLPHIINAAVFTSAFSAGNSFLYSSSRVLFGLSIRGQVSEKLHVSYNRTL